MAKAENMLGFFFFFSLIFPLVSAIRNLNGPEEKFSIFIRNKMGGGEGFGNYRNIDGGREESLVCLCKGS